MVPGLPLVLRNETPSPEPPGSGDRACPLELSFKGRDLAMDGGRGRCWDENNIQLGTQGHSGEARRQGRT